MTPRELLENLCNYGTDNEFDVVLDGWLGWEVTFKPNGVVELTVGLDDENGTVSEETWILRHKPKGYYAS